MSRHAIPEHPHFRPGTTDFDIWHEAVVGNVYRLPEEFRPGDRVLCVGAHTGAVVWRCAHSGARVLAVEPGLDNFQLLAHNTKPVWDRVTLLCAAAWGGWDLLPYQRNWMPLNHGGGCTMGDAGTPEVHQTVGVPLDALLTLRPSWRLLQLDCEGAEFNALYGAYELARVNEVAAEYHERPGHADASGRRFVMDDLRAYLEGLGFAVEVDSKGQGMGYLFARRPA